MFDPVAYAEGEALGQELKALRRQIDDLELRFSSVASDFSRLIYYMEEGFTSPLNWIYAGANAIFSQSLQIASPVYSVGDLSLANSAKIMGAAGKIGVGGNLYQSTVQNQIGLTGGGDPRLAEAHVVGRCSVKGNVVLHDCGGTPTATNWDVDFIFESSANHSLAGLLSYTPSLTCCGTTSDMGFWYKNADLGPNHACTTGSVPFSFDTGDGIIKPVIRRLTLGAHASRDQMQRVRR